MSAVATESTTIEYNGFKFNATAKSKVQVEPILDEAQRTVIYQQITINVVSTIAADEGTDRSLDTIKQKLSQQGAALKFFDQGFGDLAINTLQGSRDVKWGPVPKVLSWTPIGSSRACEVEWSVVCHVTPCRKFTGIMSLNYEVDYDIDNAGTTKRNITGHIEIAQTRQGKQVPDSADNYRKLINPAIPLGYKRDRQTYHLSKDKSRLDFTINDSQINSPNAFPPGVVEIDGGQKASWRKGQTQFGNTINLKIKLAEDAPPRRAYEIFHTIASARIAQAKRDNQSPVHLERIDLDEPFFSRESSFSISFVVLKALIDLRPGGGMWEPLGTDWSRWHVSMVNSFSSRGHSGLFHAANQDAIVDLCGGSHDPQTQSNRPLQLPNQISPTFQNPTPPAKQSWLKYKAEIFINESSSVVRQQVLQDPNALQQPNAQAFDVNATGPPKYDQGNGLPDVIQEIGIPSYSAVFVGYAERVGHQIPRPVLEKIGNQPAVLTRDRFQQRMASVDLGVPVFQARWRLDYALAQAPGIVKLPPNPMEGTDLNGRVKR